MPIPASAQPARAAELCTVVIFGASGDLTQRKLVPALYNLRHDGLLPDGCALVGFADDYLKIVRHSHHGLIPRYKMGGQVIVAAAVGVTLLLLSQQNPPLYNTRLIFPFFKNLKVSMNQTGFILLGTIVLTGSSNAVNLTDGLDGLASGSAVFAFATLAVIGYWQFRHTFIYHVPQGLDLALAAMALTGACAGFLWWNAAPARIFMGDTGSLAIGAGLAGLCLQMNLVLLLPVIAGLFVLVTLSVIIQVASFRLFHRRVFRMAPFITTSS